MEYALKIMPQDGEVLVLGRIENGNVLILVKDSRPRVALEGMGAASSYLPGRQVTARWRAVRGGIGVDDHPLDCAAPSREFFFLAANGKIVLMNEHGGINLWLESKSHCWMI